MPTPKGKELYGTLRAYPTIDIKYYNVMGDEK
jgi:hypothetical protein